MKNKTQLFHLYTFRFFLSVGLFFILQPASVLRRKSLCIFLESHTIWI